MKIDSVSAIVLNNLNHVLVSERRGQTGHGKLSFPGGKLNLLKTPKGEVLEDAFMAVYRESIEEACIRLKEIKYFKCAETKFTNKPSWFTYYFLAKSLDTPYENEPKEQVNWQWLDLANFNNPSDNFFFPINDLIIKVNDEGSTFQELILNSRDEPKEQSGEINKLF
jgi:ADP-ribose pyrophosphatase YjhB (NUDIX family)